MFTDYQSFAKDRVIIMSAPNGARRTQADHPALPIAPEELADCAVSLVDAGVSVLHLHVRDEHQKHSLDIGRYRAAIDGIQAAVGNRLIIQVTTESVGRYQAAEQMELIRQLRPEAVSLALGELCPAEKNEKQAAEFFSWLVSAEIWPQYILYSPQDVARFDELRLRGVFADEHPFCLFVLGRYSEELTGELSELDAMLAAADPEAFPWAVCCFGKNEYEVSVKATSCGGHVRIGFENNLQLNNGQVAANNSQLVTQFRKTIEGEGRRPAAADDIRQALGRR